VAAPDVVTVESVRLDDLQPGRHRLARAISSSADGGQALMPVNVVRGLSDRPRIVAVAGVHGDEHEGPAALLDLFEELDPGGLRGTLVTVPIANPPAFKAMNRWNPLDGVDMNRSFPADPSGSVTHRLAYTLIEEIVRGADFLVTIHGWTAGSLTIPYVEYPGGTERLASAARDGAAAFGLRYMEPRDAKPGRLLTLATKLGVPACEVELGGEGIVLPERTAVGLRGLRGILQQFGLLEGQAERPTGQCDIVRHTLMAPAGGLLRRQDTRLGAQVSAGQPIASITGLNGALISELLAPTSGVLATLRHSLAVEPGDLVAAIFATRP
jgi:uncharacterized protein